MNLPGGCVPGHPDIRMGDVGIPTSTSPRHLQSRAGGPDGNLCPRCQSAYQPPCVCTHARRQHRYIPAAQHGDASIPSPSFRLVSTGMMRYDNGAYLGTRRAVSRRRPTPTPYACARVAPGGDFLLRLSATYPMEVEAHLGRMASMAANCSTSGPVSNRQIHPEWRVLFGDR